jgi:hypothetical protein
VDRELFVDEVAQAIGIPLALQEPVWVEADPA